MTRHALIYSTGRAGSNRLLDILDQHPWTNCRNEPSRIQPPFHALWNRDFAGLSPAEFDQRWYRLVRNARLEQGAADRLQFKRKAYVRPVPGWTWSQIARRTKLRRAIGISENVWKLPKICIKANVQQDKILPVLKTGGNPSMVLRHHLRQTDQFLLHTLRRPDAYLKSWFNRHVLPKPDSYGKLQKNTRAFLRDLLPPEQANQLPKDDSLETLVRLELIKWRACHEPLMTALGNQPRQMIVTFEEISQDPVGQARRIFSWLDLDCPDDVQARIANLKNKLFTKPNKAELPQPMLSELLSETLTGSPLLSFWPDWQMTNPLAPQISNSVTKEV